MRKTGLFHSKKQGAPKKNPEAWIKNTGDPEKTCRNFLRFLYKKYFVLYKFQKVLYKNMKQQREKPKEIRKKFFRDTA